MRAIICALSAVLLLSGPACRAQDAPVALTDSWTNLEGNWRFQTDPFETGEAEGWASEGLDDSGWRTLRVPGSWEPQGVTDPRPGEAPRPKNGMTWTDYDGVGWYRLRVVVPAAWAGQELVLSLGRIDDQDRAYFNGELVGETGPGLERAVLSSRSYPVAADRVKFGGVNVVALRVFDGGGPGGVDGPLVSLLPRTLAEEGPKLPGADRPFEERFAEPPADARILPIIHGWPDDPREQDVTIRSSAAQGFGGFVCNVSFDQYLTSETHWAALQRAVAETKKAGMALWLYDERGYPSGAAGGQTLEGHPEWEARGLLVAQATSEGGAVTVQAPPGKLVRALAVPGGAEALDAAVELTDRVADGKLEWTAPAGNWRVVVITESELYDGTHASMSLADKLPYINLLMPEPTKRFLDLTHDAYAARLGPDLGKVFEATFTDEPSLMSVFMQRRPYAPLPWAPNLPAEFRARRGYNLGPLLPALVLDLGGAEKQVRYDFWKTVGELVAQNYFGQIEQRCRKWGLPSGGHLLCEESFSQGVPFYGDFMACLRELGAPSIDCLTSLPAEVPWYVSRMIGSVADLSGARLTMSEASDFGQVYRPEGDTRPVRPVTEDEVRGSLNRQMWGGINTITSYYTWQNLRGAPTRRLNDYVGRVCTSLRGGHQVADIALLYPTESLWPRYVPSGQWGTDAAPALAVEQALVTARDSLWRDGRDFSFVDGRALEEATVEGDSLVLGDLRWRVVVLPADTLSMRAWEKVAAFWRSGGAVVFVGMEPTNSATEFPSASVQSLGREMLGEGADTRAKSNAAGGVAVYLQPGSSFLLPWTLKSVVERDVIVEGASAQAIHATHRRVDGQDLYFLINDSDRPWSGTVTTTGTGQGRRLDPVTGAISALPEAGPVPVELGPYGGVLLAYPSARPRQRLEGEDGAAPELVTEALPETTPGIGKGEFVDGEISRLDGSAQDLKWRATARLLKGDVDTFMFMGFRWPEGVDLSGALALSVKCQVPEGQRAPTKLLMIVVERGGGQFLAETSVSLSEPGTATALVPLERFTPAGWSQDANGQLDLDEVAALSIGWGGYFGDEGEEVRFALGQPGVLKIR